VERRDLREFLLPANWDTEARRVFDAYGKKPRMGGGVRGPITAAMSIYGVENLIYLIRDRPTLAGRFRDVLADSIIGMTRVYYDLCGTPDRRGFGFADDNCAMLNAEMYAFFGVPILKRVFGKFAPGPDDTRHQHSDSAMTHLLPLLNEAGVNHGNYGPTVRVEDIRRAMPRCVIHGQLAPWTFARGTDEEVAAEVRRDIEAAGAYRGSGRSWARYSDTAGTRSGLGSTPRTADVLGPVRHARVSPTPRPCAANPWAAGASVNGIAGVPSEPVSDAGTDDRAPPDGPAPARGRPCAT
jgi:uroporphyrinogen decarboxylase